MAVPTIVLGPSTCQNLSRADQPAGKSIQRDHTSSADGSARKRMTSSLALCISNVRIRLRKSACNSPRLVTSSAPDKSPLSNARCEKHRIFGFTPLRTYHSKSNQSRPLTRFSIVDTAKHAACPQKDQATQNTSHGTKTAGATSAAPFQTRKEVAYLPQT